MRRPDRRQRFGNAADLVGLDEDGIAAAELDALLQPPRVGDKQVVSDQLHLAAQLFGQQLPALPIFFIQAVFDGADGIISAQALPMRDQLRRSKTLARFRQQIFAAPFRLPLAGRGVQRQHDLFPLPIPRPFDRSQNDLQRLFIARKVGREPAFVADGSRQPARAQDRRQGMVHLRTPAQSFAEARRARRHDHKFLHVDVVGGVRAAVKDIHHRHGQTAAPSQKAVQRHLARLRRRIRRRKGNRQDGVRTQSGLIGRAVRLDHRRIHRACIGGIQPEDGLCNRRIDIFDRPQDALAAIARPVAVAQLQRFKFARRSAARRTSPARRAVRQKHLRFHRRVAARIDDLAPPHLDNAPSFHRKPPKQCGSAPHACKEYARFEEIPYTQPAAVRKGSPVGGMKRSEKSCTQPSRTRRLPNVYQNNSIK